jgi:rod shape-determining protein MreB
MAVCVPSGVTEVEKRAVEEAAKQAGARHVFIIEEPLAAAIGAGIDIEQPSGSMVVDIGGGTTDVAVISLGAPVVSTSIKVAGDNFDEAIVRYMHRQHNLLIGERMAEELKIEIGTAYPFNPPYAMEARGRDLLSGLPKSIVTNSIEMMDALYEPVTNIMKAIHVVLENTPPELASDIAARGIIMTGGGAMLTGLDELIAKQMGIDAIVAENALSAVALGTGKFLEAIVSDIDTGKRR